MYVTYGSMWHAHIAGRQSRERATSAGWLPLSTSCRLNGGSTGVAAMKPGTIFISHRAEYGNLVRELKKAIETTSRGKIEAIISEDLPGARRPAFWHQGGYSRNSSIHRLRRARASRRPPALGDTNLRKRPGNCVGGKYVPCPIDQLRPPRGPPRGRPRTGPSYLAGDRSKFTAGDCRWRAEYCQGDKSQDQIQIMTSAIGEATTKAAAVRRPP
jgi:hypothetical protein